MNEFILFALGVSVVSSLAWMAAFSIVLFRGQAIEGAAL